jgi:DNA polymerase V
MSDAPVFGLIDGNSFFASCEKVYRPDLRHSPVIVLSNNDGCVVARSPEAKALGIKMGEPFFKIEKFCEDNKVVVFSSNYALYANLSGRMMGTIAEMTGEIYPYSIDECFVRLESFRNLEKDFTAFGRRIRERVLNWVGIPTCVGIAPTQTLAKYTNHLAKTYKGLGGVCNWFDLTPERQRKALACQPAGEVWGVGRQTNERLARLGIRTALDLADASDDLLARHFGIVLMRTARELRGTPCIEMDTGDRTRKQIVRSRSFGELVYTKEDLLAAITTHAQEAALTLRKEGTCTQFVGIQLATNPFRESDPQYSVSPCKSLEFATNDTVSIIHAASDLLNAYYRPGFAYKRAGVYLTEVKPADQCVPDLFSEAEKKQKDELTALVDRVNAKYGKNTLHWASSKMGTRWEMKRDRLSPICSSVGYVAVAH